MPAEPPGHAHDSLLGEAFVPALTTEEFPERRSSAHDDKGRDQVKMAVTGNVKAFKGLADALRVRQHKSTRQFLWADRLIHHEHWCRSRAFGLAASVSRDASPGVLCDVRPLRCDVRLVWPFARCGAQSV